MMNMFFDPAYAYHYGNPFGGRRKKKKPKIATDDMDIFEKFMVFQNWLDSMEERKKSKEPKKDDKKPDPKKGDPLGLAMLLMVISFFGGQASLLYILANVPK